MKLVHGPQGGDQRCSDPRVPVFAEMVHDVSLPICHVLVWSHMLAGGSGGKQVVASCEHAHGQKGAEAETRKSMSGPLY